MCKKEILDQNSNKTEKLAPFQDDYLIQEESTKQIKFEGLQYVKTGDFSIVYKNAIFFAFGMTAWVISYYSIYAVSWKTNIWNVLMTLWSGLGIGAGVHRLWAHRSYKAKLPLRIFLAIGQSIAGQNCIYIWSRDHRVHHKFSDTDADPHNIKRGAFFSHVGWLIYKKHPEVTEKGKKLIFDDLLEDPVVYWQQIFYYPIYVIFALFLPVYIPIAYWGENMIHSFALCYLFRQGFVLHATWFVNSASHLFGEKPYDAVIPPSENYSVSMFTLGEGYHNYHHSFPYDYRASEGGPLFNFNKRFIDLMARWGQAYDLKMASEKSIASMKQKALTHGHGHSHSH